MGAPVHNPAHLTPGQMLGGVLAGEHHVDENAQGVDVGADVRLGQAVLLRGGVAGGAQNLGVVTVLRLMQPGGVKVDEHRLRAPEHNVLRLHIPVDGADGVEDPQGLADLAHN